VLEEMRGCFARFGRDVGWCGEGPWRVDVGAIVRLGFCRWMLVRAGARGALGPSEAEKKRCRARPAPSRDGMLGRLGVEGSLGRCGCCGGGQRVVGSGLSGRMPTARKGQRPRRRTAQGAELWRAQCIRRGLCDGGGGVGVREHAGVRNGGSGRGRKCSRGSVRGWITTYFHRGWAGDGG